MEQEKTKSSHIIKAAFSIPNNKHICCNTEGVMDFTPEIIKGSNLCNFLLQIR